MDEFLDQYFSSSSWSEVNAAKENSSWDYYSESDQRNGLLPSSLRVYKEDEKNSPGSILSANHTMESLAAQDTSSAVLGGESSDYGVVDKSLLSGEAQNRNLSSNGSLKFGNAGLCYDAAAIPTLSSVNHGSPKQLAVVGDMTSSLSYLESGHFGGHDSELSEIQRSLRNLQTLSPIPELWLPPSHEEVSSLSPVNGRDGTQGFGLQGTNLNNVIDTTAHKYAGVDRILQLDNLSASITTEGKQDLQNHPLSSFAAGPQMTMTTVGLSSLQQTTSTAPTNGFNGNGKPRVRARRGQATDPHSIAERLRREKIAERMKNLQELVPNSNKTDKASMLDEIIDYVKFLQLQVKVLSMSRLGAAGAVLPLITEAQTEGSNGLSLSAQAGQGVDISLNPDQVAFEEEVVKLMESSVTMAMQYLQSKGLCLMPMALASAISNEKVLSPGFASEERKKFGSSNGLVQNNSGSSSSSNGSFPNPNDGIGQMSSEGNIIVGKPIREGIVANAYGCNGAVRQGKETNICSARELKPKT
ncbi:hypothetical protein Q3G72_033786 [Acer saccharum]|nr:hypothetical protein Q3G72_033786 [Acer saccharum]